ncbi:non-heme iron oxygenase ferredoxin subunit [Pelagibacterium mangrovi]|uniref:non-heme iron oxygenase ferredoxin subunit n=1 Tax=Pelagibacterium mangrovi TaxID=3119828 RepID=UPI002FC62B19
MGHHAICDVDEVTPGEPLKVDFEDRELAVFNVEGTVYVIDDQCTHGPGSLSEGELDGYVIECDFHQGGFDIRTGEAVIPPCMIPVRTYAVEIRNGKVMIDLDQAAIACANKIAANS